MFHDGCSDSRGTHYESLNEAKFNFALGRRCDTILFDRINEKRDKSNQPHMKRSTFDDICLKSKWIFAEDAVKLGLADVVEYPPNQGKE
jgi:hypothetical protein